MLNELKDKANLPLIVTIMLCAWLITGCSTLSPEEREEQRWDRQEARLVKAELKEECRLAQWIWFEDRFGRGQCISKRELADLLGGW